MRSITTLILLLSSLTVTLAQPVLIHQEDFETTPSWTYTTTCVSYPWLTSTSKASSGTTSAAYNSYNAPSGCTANLYSPLQSVTNAGPDDSIYMYLDVYRDPIGSTWNDRFELHFTDASDNSLLLPPGTIYRYYQKSPISGVSGWVSYIFKAKLDLAGSGPNVDFKLMVKAIAAGGYDMYMDNIRIYHIKKAPPLPVITLTNPNGGMAIAGGTAYNITWYSPSIAKINLEFSINGGLNWNSIATNVNGSAATYVWNVPLTSSPSCKVRVMDASNTSNNDESDSYFQIYNSVGVEDFQTASSLKIYPNPTSGLITIMYDQPEKHGVQLSIKDLTGRTILNKTADIVNGQLTLDLGSELTPGIYFLELNDGIRNRQQKFVLSAN
jgi:hypothetical protein